MVLIDYIKRNYLAMIQTDPIKYVKYLRKKGVILEIMYIYTTEV